MASYYQGAGGDDGNAGTSWGARFATIQKLMDTGEPGDSLYLQGETVAAQIVSDMNGGAIASPTITTPIYVYGVDSSGNVLTGTTQAAITASASMTSLMYCAAAADYYYWSNIKFDGGGSGKASYCFEGQSGQDVDGYIFKNCRFTNSDSTNVMVSGNIPWFFNNCEIDNAGKGGSTGHGFYSRSNARPTVKCYGCSIHDNLQNGFLIGKNNNQLEPNVFYNCLIYKNGLNGILTLATTGPSAILVINCTFYSNSSSHISASATPHSFLVLGIRNSIFSSAGAYAFNHGGTDVDYLNVFSWSNNCFYNNTSGNIDVLGGTAPGDNNVLANPLFTSTTAGSENFTLQSGSPCIGAGCNPVGYSTTGLDIGAVQSVCGGGGFIQCGTGRIGVMEG